MTPLDMKLARRLIDTPALVVNGDLLPPHSPEAEAAAVGCALEDPTLAPELRPEWFFDQRFGTVAKTLLAFSKEGKVIAHDTVVSALKKVRDLEGTDPVGVVDHCIGQSLGQSRMAVS